MTDIVIHQLDTANQADLNRCDNAFTVDAELCLDAADGKQCASACTTPTEPARPARATRRSASATLRALRSTANPRAPWTLAR